MVDKNKQTWAGCPIRFAMKNFGDKWSFLIVRDLMFKNKKYYQDFLDAGEGISTNILASRLVELENNGVIRKVTDPEKKSRYIYSLTQKGKDLLPVMFAMINWAEIYDPVTEVPKDFIEKLRNDPEVLSNEIMENL
ncbi:winged helix-turn-helix transcriptional regulator [Pseudemcibacter aquimaris]|uniref:winged helix-turn-helix transcriptional regulator n=1 Tax=Pseudemcibacter aquimaris TaxID=2857064 RepID=UPI002011B4B9|nr:helix-turn-helix domain-containing protein [Pseudemcibacter aquimaris]MCC3859619.1 helix-turn-helix transcriptional regulator [Pseudemcibacter aquimaris]WDU60014.1 helix-turn-helix transcriptional regulator [Pseudemcibacter aquimaris]